MSALAVDLRPPAPADADELAAGLRQQDIDELNAAGHHDHRAVIADGVARSDWCLTALVGGRVACIFGVARMGTLLDPRGIPWMLGTDLVQQHRRAFVRLAPHYIQRMLQDYPHLVNVVHARNTLAVRWLQRAGFALRPPHQHNGEPFHVFEMTRHV